MMTDARRSKAMFDRCDHPDCKEDLLSMIVSRPRTSTLLSIGGGALTLMLFVLGICFGITDNNVGDVKKDCENKVQAIQQETFKIGNKVDELDNKVDEIGLDVREIKVILKKMDREGNK